jgi:uncharacterized oxidoreductase
MPTVKAESLLTALTSIFQVHDVPLEDARVVAEHLVDAEACGVASHGVIRVPQYVQAIAGGHIRPDAKLQVLSETVSTAVLDGQHGFGQVMARRAMDHALERAERTGVGAVTLRNCSHTGRLGSYTERAARRGRAGLMLVNTGGHGQWVVPFGGTAGRLATNPLSIAVPADGDDPLLLDIATSAVPEGKIRALLAAGRAIPEGWVIDHRGRSTTNPADLYGPPRGALLPFGEHKGFGLAVLIDALAGGLSGAGCCWDPNAPLAGQTDGALLLAVQIEAFCPLVEFRRHISRLIQHIKSSPPAPGIAEVLTPGELEASTRRQRLKEGIPVETATWQMIQPIMDQVGVTCPVV